MPSIIPIGGYLSGGVVVRRFAMPASVIVMSPIESTGLPASADVAAGEGALAMVDVVSEVVDSAR